MQGSWVNESLGKRSKMACPFSTSRIIDIFISLSLFYCLCAAEKEYILNQSNLWDNESSSNEGGTSRWNSAEDDSMFACPQRGQAELPLKQLDLKGAKRVFVEIEYIIVKTFGNSGGLSLISSSGATPEDDARSKRIVNNNKTPNRTKTTLFYDSNEDDHLLNLTLYASKACVRVFKITVYYHVCPTNETLKVTRTVAPVSGYIEASANCSIKQSGKKGSVVVAKCGSNGKWVKVEDKEGGCSSDCDAGAELISDTCKVCKENYYKEKRGTHACTPCPKNTVSESSRTTCKCKKVHYRSTKNGPCKTIPSMPKNPNYIRLPFNTIKLHWNISHNEAHPDLHFHVTCKQYFGISDWGSCRNLSLAARGVNVTSPALEIKHLLNNTNYTFSIAALNNVSIHVRPQQWSVATVNVLLAGNPVPIGSDQTATVPSTDRTSPKTTVKPEVQTTERKSTDVPGSSTIAISSEGEASKNASEIENKNQVAPYIGIAIGATLLIVGLTVIVIYRRKRMKKRTLGTEEGLLLNACPQAYVDPTKYGNPEKAVKKFAKEIDRREIKLEEIIGEGEFAKVHKGMLCRPNEPTVPVALKILKPGSTPKNREDFLTEAAVMGQFKDLNIVALEGVVTISHPVMIITEFMHNGALSNYLVKNKNRFSEVELLGMARGIGSGMKYLAKMRFVHRDLAARNVLVNENLVCKVADFGLTRELEDSDQGEYVTQGGKIPIRWTAPEAYKHRRFTTASDVWSFGIVLWEIMTYADRPYGNWDNYMVMEQVTANYRLFPPTNCPKIVHQLMMECWKADRNQRPSFSDIVEMLERWIRNPYLLKDYQYVTEKDRMADRKSCVAKTIRDYLEVIKMDRYIDNFIDFGYTELYQIQNITDDDLVNIGVPLIGHRNKIIKSLRGERELLLPVDV